MNKNGENVFHLIHAVLVSIENKESSFKALLVSVWSPDDLIIEHILISASKQSPRMQFNLRS